ncbi:MAG: Cna B-type domain-containing protein, partial [Clostridiaceae bacterium]
MSVDFRKTGKNLLSLFLLFTFLMGFLPFGMTLRAEESGGEIEPAMKVQITADVKWVDVPDGVDVPDISIQLKKGSEVLEEKILSSGNTTVHFAEVDKFDSEGNEIAYSLALDNVEGFETEINGYTVQNTYIKPAEPEPAEENPPADEVAPGDEEPPGAEDPPVEPPTEPEPPPVEDPPAVEEPPAEEPPAVEEPPADDPPAVVEPPVENPPAEDPPAVVEPPVENPPAVDPPAVEEPPVESPPAEDPPPAVEEPPFESPPAVEEPPVENPPAEVPSTEEVPENPGTDQIGQPVGPDRLILGTIVSDIPVYETVPLLNKSTNNSTTSLPSASVSTTMVSPTIPGQVTIDKYAVPVPGLVNTWDVTLRIEGMETAKSSDIVLVIDRSGSMLGTKLSGAKTAAKAFVSALADDPNTRIALVSFASAYNGATTVTTHTGLLNVNVAANRTTLNNAIDSLVALGGTNTQAGIRAASQILATSTADYKNIVLLSDGEPTQSYQINNVLTKLEAYGQNETVEAGGGTYTANVAFRTRSNLLAGDYNYSTTVGFGSAAYTRIGDSGQNYYSHGNSAIAQAAMFKSLGADRILWTIALETTAYGNSVLESIASPGKDFTAQTSDLNTIFLQIAGSINAAARDITVDDPMGPGFEIPAANVGDIVVSQGSATYIGGVISWNVGDLFKPISVGSNIKYAEMTYRVSITDDILLLLVPPDGRYPTNGDADVTFKDSNGATQTVDFPIPKVNPIFLKVKKTLLDAAGTEILDPARSFDIRIKSDNTDGDVIYPEYDHTYTLIPGQSIIKTNLRLADIYTVSETATDYDITIKVNGTVVSTFEVLPPAGIPLADTGQNDIEVEVINKEKPLGKLILKKVLVDENDVLILNDTREFTFTITGPETPGVFDGEETTTLKGGDTVTIEGLRYGTYTVVETDPGLGFTVTSVPMDGKATLAWNSKEGTVTITNKYVSPPRDVVAKKIWENGPEEDHVPVTLTLYRQIGLNPKEEVTGVTPVIVPAAGPATEFVYTWSNLPKTDVHGVEYIYTVDELVIPTGYDKSISDDGLTVTNKRKVSSLQLLKLNVAGAPLQGAEFELYRKVTETE